MFHLHRSNVGVYINDVLVIIFDHVPDSAVLIGVISEVILVAWVIISLGSVELRWIE